MIVTKLKKGVSLVGMVPQLVYALGVAAALAVKRGWPYFVITSVNDSIHSYTSLHWNGCGVDIRIRDPLSGQAVPDPQAFVDDLNEALGPDFDVILESDHIHLEYQPKRRK